MDNQRMLHSLSLAHSATYLAVGCTSTVMILLSAAPEKIDWKEVLEWSERAQDELEEAIHFSVPGLASFTDDASKPLRERWTVRFSTALRGISDITAYFAKEPKRAVRDAKKLLKSDPSWLGQQFKEFDQARDAVTPFIDELLAMLGHADYLSLANGQDQVEHESDQASTSTVAQQETTYTMSKLSERVARSRTTVRKWAKYAGVEERNKGQGFTLHELSRISTAAQALKDEEASVTISQIVSESTEEA